MCQAFESPGRRTDSASENESHIDAAGYFLTFRTYGTWLHGDARGSVDRDHNQFGTPYFPPDARRELAARSRLRHSDYVLCQRGRRIVDRSTREVCRYRGWELHACNVRTNHVHLVLSAPETPERVMNSLKSWSTRGLIADGLVHAGTKVWARHGSTVYLWKDDDIAAACQYVTELQDDGRCDE
jgi:REP element-mobilizing transposase RayT